jgi:ABC-2 type transport system ATP-binding protein
MAAARLKRVQQPLLSLSDVRKRYGRRLPWVLQGIDLNLHAGTGTTVVGGNGSGKSTILRIAAGLARQTSGLVSRPSSIGYVPERQPATVRMSGAEYVAGMGKIRGLRQSEIDSKGAELFERLGLRPGPEATIGSLSKGNRQKIFLSQALLAPVDLLLLDEPFAGLDVFGTRGLVEILDERMAAGATVLMSTHESQVVPGSFRVLRLGDGVFVDPAIENLADRRVSVGVRVVLEIGAETCDADALSKLAGVRSASFDGSRGTLLLVLDPQAREPTLTAAIASGWRVLTVESPAPSPKESGNP